MSFAIYLSLYKQISTEYIEKSVCTSITGLQPTTFRYGYV